jgi:ligand-binding sensor domain-containing protein/DNA-binding CsgD family transcriptional regulator
VQFFQKYLIAVVCSMALDAAGQEAPRVRNFEPADYGGQNQNWSLAQSPEGWLYVGNNGGLLEFDGARWQFFSLPEKQTLRAVAAGRDGEIFCGGFAEFGFWKMGENGRLAYTSLSSQVRNSRVSKEEIWHILALPEYVLFQSFSTIYKYDYQKVTVLGPPNSIMFAHEVKGRVLLPVIGRGLYELMPNDSFQFVSGTEILQDKIVQFMVPGKAGAVWAGTTNHGIFEIKNGSCRVWENPLNAEFRQFQLNKATALQNGGWAIGTILNGAYILDSLGQLRFHLHRENGLQNNTVLAMQEDRDGNLWLGLDRGIDFLALRSPLTFFSDQTGKIGTVYTAAHWGGRLYIGTNQGVFSRKELAKNRFSPSEKFQLVEGTQGQVWQLQVFDNQLICGHNGGTIAIENGSVRKVSEVTGGWCAVRVPSRPDALLQSTYTGLIVFQKNESGRWQFARRVGGFSEPLKKIVFDEQGYLWGVHPSKGLFRLRLDGDLTRATETRTFTRADGLPTDFQLDLAIVNGQIIVNTAPVALKVMTESTQVRFEEFRDLAAAKKWLNPLSNHFFIIDSSGLCLWRSDGRRYDLPLSLVPNYENVVALPDSSFLFCLENGFARLDLPLLTNADLQKMPPSPVIRSMETADGSVFLGGGNWQIPYRQNSLRFHFAVPFYEHQPKFSWRLDGFSANWSAWQSIPEKEFTNLPEGEYTLRLRADTGGQEATVTFRIAPPWYRSVWAMGVYSLLAISLFWGMEKYNRLRLERQRRRLTVEKQRELQSQRTEAEREKLLLEVENKSRELSNAALNLIRKNEVLQRLKDDLLDSKNEPRALQKIVRLIDEHLEGDHDWEIFEESFNRVHDDFFKRLMHDFPDLTPGDLRLAAYLKMNLSSKEIAPLLNISVRGIENKRYRLRKKLGLPEEANLTEFIMNF